MRGRRFSMPSRRVLLGLVALSWSAGEAFAAPSIQEEDATPVVVRPRALPSDPGLEMFDPDSLRARFELLSRPITEEEPAVPATDTEMMIEVRESINQGEIDSAISRMEDDLSSDTGAMTDYYLGTLYYGKSDWMAAEAAFSRACEKAPDFRRAWMQLADVRMKQSRFEDAIPSLIRACELGATDPITLGMLAYAHGRNGDDLAAEESYRRVLLGAPNELRGLIGLAQTLGVLGHHAAAASVLGRIARRNPDEAQWWFHQGVAYRKAGRFELMTENLELVDGLGGSTPDSLFTLAQSYANQNLWTAAVDRFLEYLEMDKSASADRLNKPIRFMIRRNEYDQAARLINGIWAARGEVLEPEQRKELLKHEARLASGRGHDDVEAEVLARVVELDPDDGETMLLLGNYHARQEDGLEKALGWYVRAVDVPEVATEARLAQASALARNGRVAEAIEILDESERLDPRPEIEVFRDKLVAYLRARDDG